MLTGQFKAKGMCSHGPQPDTSVDQGTHEFKNLRSISNLYAGQFISTLPVFFVKLF